MFVRHQIHNMKQLNIYTEATGFDVYVFFF